MSETTEKPTSLRPAGLFPTAPASVIGIAELTHGTCEQLDLKRSKQFVEKVLNIRCVRHGEPAQMFAGQNDMAVVAVGVGKVIDQGSDNRWILAVNSLEDVAIIRRQAIEATIEFGIKQVTPIMHDGKATSFMVQDPDGNWFEVVYRARDYYSALFKAGSISEYRS